MRKLTAVLLLVATAAVLAAAAGAKRPKPAHPTKSAALTNAAHLCKAMRTANPSLFRSTFGTNHNRRNAYGKCVSARAHAKRRSGTVTLSNLTVSSTGTVTGAGAANCQSSTAGCTVTSTGNVSGAYSGSYSSSFTIAWTSATSNGAGGFCAPATGTVTLSLTGLGTLTKAETGTVCEIGATGSNVPHAFNGSFTVASGTGVFAGATGSGSSTWTQEPGSSNALGGSVSGSETFTTLTLEL